MIECPAATLLNWLVSKEAVIAVPKSEENVGGGAGWRMKPKDYHLLEQAFQSD